MSSPFPIINRWQEEGLVWRYIFHSRIAPLQIRANGEVDLTYDEYRYRYPELFIVAASGVFDHPSCGIRLMTEPNFDTEDFFTIDKIMVGIARSEPLVYASVPPETPPGIFIIRVPSFWKGEEYLKISVINTDSAPHTCISIGYHIIATTGKKK